MVHEHRAPQVGQVWTANDPRRLRAVRILAAGPLYLPNQVLVQPVYPRWSDPQTMTVDQFRTGSKGYSRLS